MIVMGIGVDPGKYKFWQVRIWYRTAGESVIVICEVRAGYLF